MLYYKNGCFDVRRPTKTDIKYVAKYMRREDIIECRDCNGSNPLDAIKTSVDLSDESYAIK